MNKKQGGQMQFSLEKRLEKRKLIHQTHRTSRWIVLKNGVFDSSILLETFHLYQNVYHAAEKKSAEMR